MRNESLCFICRKHAGQLALPPGGSIYEDEDWIVCHAPVAEADAGTLLIEPKRHFCNFAGMNAAEAESYGPLLRNVCAALQQVTGSEQIYAFVLPEGVPHLHTRLVPDCVFQTSERVLDYLARPHACSRGKALAIVRRLRKALPRSRARSA